MALDGGQRMDGAEGGGGVLEEVEVTVHTCLNTKGTWLVSTLTSKLHGNQHSLFFLLPPSISS